jgi:cephalosporin-C deacetylase-like acetyl esterase
MLSCILLIGNATTISGEKDVDVTITPKEKKGSFTDKTKVLYLVKIKNNLDQEQTGTISYTVSYQQGKEVSHRTYDIKVPGKKKFETEFTVPHNIEGVFEISFQINLTNITSKLDYQFAYGIGKKQKYKAEKDPARVKTVPVEGLAEEPKPSDEGEIVVKLTPEHPDGTWLGPGQIVYDVHLQNKYKENQEGTISYTIKDAVTGQQVAEKIYDVNLKKKTSRSLKFSIDPPPHPGIFNIALAINTTSYDDTTHYAFGYEVDQINSPMHKPADFDEFWKKALDELAEVNPAYKIEEAPEKSTSDYKVYRIEMNSLENVRVNGWLTMPRTLIKGKKFPVVVLFPGYQVLMRPLFFNDFIGLSLNVRGMDKKSEAYPVPENEEILTYNIRDPEKYIYRGIYMDCIRAIDFVFANQEMGMDVGRITVLGGSQGAALAMVVSSLRNKQIQTCIADVPIYCDMYTNLAMEPQMREEAFTFRYINRYLDRNKGSFSKAEFLQNFSYFEIQNFVPNIRCTVLMGASFLDALAPPTTIFCAFNKLHPWVHQNSEIYTFPTLAHAVPDIHNLFKNTWMYEKLVKSTKKKKHG